MATLTGAGMTMGVAGDVVNVGAFAVWQYVGFGLGLICFSIISPRIRGAKKQSLSTLIAGEFGNTPRVIVAVLCAIYCMGSATICIRGMSSIIVYVAEPWGVSIETATIVTTLIAIIYTTLGGLYADVWADVIQFLIMASGIIIIGPAVSIIESGGIGIIADFMQSNGVSLYNPFQGNNIVSILSIMLIMFSATWGDPTVPQRAMASVSGKSAKKSFFIAGVSAILFGIGILIIGAGGAYLIPDLVERYGTSEAVFPIFVLNYFPTGMKGFMIAAVISAILSTLDSMLLMASTSLVYDVGSVIKPGASDKQLNKGLRIGVIILGSIGLFVALKLPSMLSAMYFIFSLVTGAFLAPLLATLYWEKATKWGITLGVVSGAVVVIGMYIGGVMGLGGDPAFTGLIIPSIFVYIVSYLTGGSKSKRVLTVSEEA